MKKSEQASNEEVVAGQPVIQQPTMANVAELKAYAYDLLTEIEQKTNILRQVNTAIQQAQQEISNAVKEQQAN